MSNGAQDARQVPLSKADKLHQDAVGAARVRAYQTHPDVVALRVERLRSLVDTMAWTGIILGLAFTMVNVQQFAAGTAPVGSLAWCAAWLLDPMVSLVLIAVLLAEQVTARYQVPMRVEYTGPWVKITKWFAIAATYTMNTWHSWAEHNPAGVVQHSVPPLLVFCAAEAGPIVRDRMTEAVLRAAHLATVNTASDTPDTPPVNGAAVPFMNGAGGPAMNGNHGPSVNPAVPVHDTTVREHPKPRSRSTTRKPARKPRRKLLADYINEAREHLTPGVEPTPAWVRSVVPGIGRGTSQNVAHALRRELELDNHHPDTPDTPEQEGRAA